jgi:predicted metal-dependent peptidase
MNAITNIEREATARVMKARAELILARRFYGVLVSNVEPVCSRQVRTMATNSKQHFFNPDFIEKLTQTQLLAVQAHESEHDARHHSTRRGWRDPLKWNIACDYAINLDILGEGFDLPEGALIDERFRGMSAEDIFRCRELDEERERREQERQQQQPEPTPKPEPDENEGEPNEPEPDDGEDEDENGEGEGENGEDEGEDESEDEDENGEGEGENGEDEGEDESEDEDENGEGSGEADADEDATRGEGESGGGAKGEVEAEGEAEAGDAEPSDNGCGEVLDAPAEDVSDIAEQDQRWERIVRQAASMAKAVGQCPGHISRDIERANNPPQDWREVLRTWFDQGALRRETWERPNRRFVGSGLYLPGNRKDGVNKVAFLVDTSGSMDAKALACVRNEAQAALDDGVIDEAVVIYGDTRVTRTDEYRTGDELEFDPRGGGGTLLVPLFKHVEALGDVSMALVFTDLEVTDIRAMPEPAYPVLFAVTGYPQRVRQLLASTPWNAPGLDVGAH